jgi:Fic family protein
MDSYTLPRPDMTNVNFSTLAQRYFDNRGAVADYVASITYPKYLTWEKARFKPVPAGFTPEEAWILGRDLRTAQSTATPITTPDGTTFSWVRLDYTDRLLNKFDLLLGGHLMSDRAKLSPSDTQRYLARGILEEAIASSQLEGAIVTRKAAREMIAENRKPTTKDQWMILNNYEMMQKLTVLYKDIPLSRELLFEMHRILAKNTMADEEIGRLRRDDEDIVVRSDDTIYYRPPARDFVSAQLDRLIDYANDNSEDHFVHPIIKAIQLHFWIGLLHPFVDGNGRIARTIFFWHLLRNDYPWITFIPISTAIKKSATSYGLSYVHAEQDNSDLTYFFDYHIRKLDQSLDGFVAYVERQRQENAAIDKKLASRAILNDRQKQIVHYLSADQKNYITVASHSTLNNISRITAKGDIDELRKLGVIFPIRMGIYIHYYAKPLD